MNNVSTSSVTPSDVKKNQEQAHQTAENKHQTALDGNVILKVLKLNITVKPAHKKCFRLYSEGLIAFTHHNIIKVHRVDYNSSQIVMMMEGSDKQDYKTLNHYLQHQKFEIQEALPLLRQLASALDMAHAKGILHRTLQGSSILINQKGDLKVSDFGIANLIESLGGSVFYLAPPEVLLYMSPEQAKAKEEVGAAADIYSLGVITYQMLAGQLPSLQERLEEEAITLATTGISPKLMKVLRQGMATDPAQRYPTASAFVEALEKADQANQQETTLFVEPPKRRRRTNPPSEQQNSSSKLTLVVLAIVLGGLLLAISFRASITSQSPEEPSSQATAIVEQERISDSTQREVSTSMPISTTIGTDGMVLVYVAAGKFTMGAKLEGEEPVHEVKLDSYWIDQTEVTTLMYATCVAEGACTPPVLDNSAIKADYYHDQSYHDYPMINVSWQQANTYCKWAGRRLPTEAEWEKAARGVERYIYPWGKKVIEEQIATQLNYCDNNCSETWRDKNVDDGYAKTAPVDSYPAGASPYGVLNMAGNVSEWVADWYDEEYYSSSPARNPKGARTGEEHVLRGGSWFFDIAHARTTKRRGFVPNVFFDHVGFRCAESP